jgi:hypothetical protein
MSCHSVQISFDGTVSQSDAEDAIDNVLTAYESVVPEQSSPSTDDNVVMRNSGSIKRDGEDYHYCLYRFSGGQDLATIVSDIEAELSTVNAGWWVVESHHCHHDEDGGGACGSWEVQSTDGTVPDGV